MVGIVLFYFIILYLEHIRKIAFIFQCSVSCGEGLRHRQLYCKSGEEVVNNALCESSQEEPPVTKEPCENDPCPTWFTGYWSQVSIIITGKR